MNYPVPYWSLFTPTLPLSDYLNYWNRYTQEERIKRICEELWKLIQAYQLLTDAVNDLDERITSLEARMAILEEEINNLITLYNELNDKVDNIDGRTTNLETRMTALEERVTTIETRLNELIDSLPEMIQDMIDQFLISPELTTKITDIVNDLVANKMDKVPTAAENNVATFDGAGQVKDSGQSLASIPTPSDLEGKMDKVPSATIDHIATYDANGQVKDGGILVSNIPTTSEIDDKVDKVVITQDNILLADGTGGLKDSTLLFSKMYIEATDETDAVSKSIDNPLSLIYIPEV